MNKDLFHENKDQMAQMIRYDRQITGSKPRSRYINHFIKHKIKSHYNLKLYNSLNTTNKFDDTKLHLPCLQTSGPPIPDTSTASHPTSLGNRFGYKGHHHGVALILCDVGWIAEDILECSHHFRSRKCCHLLWTIQQSSKSTSLPFQTYFNPAHLWQT